MKKDIPITTLFLDVGGVLMTNGWDRKARSQAAKAFNLDANEIAERHHLTYDTYEVGKLSMTEYLKRLVFYEERPFSIDDFKDFMFKQSKPYTKMIKLVRQLKEKYNLKVAVISNEGRELTEYRIHNFKLNEFVDFFIASCFVHFRKPDADIFRIALDIAQAPIERVLYIDDRPMFVRVAEDLGIRSFCYKDYVTTAAKLASFGLKID